MQVLLGADHGRNPAAKINTATRATTTTGASVSAVSTAGKGKAIGSRALPTLICDVCAARNFPEFSVNPDGKVAYRYGDDGPVTAIEIAVELPTVRVDFLSSQEGEEKDKGACLYSRGQGKGSSVMSVGSEGLELTYRRSSRRRGGLDASVKSVTVTDPRPGKAFPCIVAPGTTRSKHPVVIVYTDGPICLSIYLHDAPSGTRLVVLCALLY